MDGTPTNDAPGSFWSADVDEAAARLAAILEREDAEVLTIYDERGGYGHPDHVQVHRVGVRAAELAGTPRVYESTVDRDHLRDLMRAAREQLAPDALPADTPDPDEFDVGVDADRITTTVDVRDYVEQKRAAMAAHASQIPADSFFLAAAPEIFDAAFGSEWFIRRDAPVAGHESWLFERS